MRGTEPATWQRSFIEKVPVTRPPAVVPFSIVKLPPSPGSIPATPEDERVNPFNWRTIFPVGFITSFSTALLISEIVPPVFTASRAFPSVSYTFPFTSATLVTVPLPLSCLAQAMAALAWSVTARGAVA